MIFYSEIMWPHSTNVRYIHIHISDLIIKLNTHFKNPQSAKDQKTISTRSYPTYEQTPTSKKYGCKSKFSRQKYTRQGREIKHINPVPNTSKRLQPFNCALNVAPSKQLDISCLPATSPRGWNHCAASATPKRDRRRRHALSHVFISVRAF